MKVLREERKFQDDGIVVIQDFPSEIQARRQVFTPIIKAAHSSGGIHKACMAMDKLILDGKTYTIDDLDKLPEELMLKNLMTKMSLNITAFFSKYSIFSNHYPCKFED